MQWFPLCKWFARWLTSFPWATRILLSFEWNYPVDNGWSQWEKRSKLLLKHDFFLFSVRSVISSVYTEQPKLRYKSGYELTLSIWNRTLYFFFFWQLYCIVQLGFLPRGIRVAFPGESQLRQSRATKPTVHSRCSSVSIIQRALDMGLHAYTWSFCMCIPHGISVFSLKQRTFVGYRVCTETDSRETSTKPITKRVLSFVAAHPPTPLPFRFRVLFG